MHNTLIHSVMIAKDYCFCCICNVGIFLRQAKVMARHQAEEPRKMLAMRAPNSSCSLETKPTLGLLSTLKRRRGNHNSRLLTIEF